MSISPCTYPRCDDGSGNPTLTTLGICEFCRERFHQVLGWLFDDYQTLKNNMPKPARTSAPGGGSAPTGFGHPAEWASNTAQELAAWATEVHNNLRGMIRGDDVYEIQQTMDERVRVMIAFTYLKKKFDTLCTWDQAGAVAAEANDMHHTIRRGLGQSRLVQRLPAPCPQCGACTLTKSPGYDTVTCGACAYRMTTQVYQLGATFALDDAKDDAQTARDELLAAFEESERRQHYTRIAGALSRLASDR